MKKLIILGMALAFIGCKNDKNSEPEIELAPSHTTPLTDDSKEMAADAKDLNQTETTTAVSFEDPKFARVYQQYLALKAAFVNTNASEASAVAARFNEAQKVAVSNQELEKALMAITQSSDVAAQRTLFEDVSTLIEAEIALQTITSGTIYKQYCPMAFQGEGAYWLSNSKEVRNPYFGDKMLKCGTVEKELK
ncbi:MAG: DUF3347 domain-containing protein [Dokdonia sp.]|jgi:hypothetical protein